MCVNPRVSENRTNSTTIDISSSHAMGASQSRSSQAGCQTHINFFYVLHFAIVVCVGSGTVADPEGVNSAEPGSTGK